MQDELNPQDDELEEGAGDDLSTPTDDDTDLDDEELEDEEEKEKEE